MLDPETSVWLSEFVYSKVVVCTPTQREVFGRRLSYVCYVGIVPDKVMVIPLSDESPVKLGSEPRVMVRLSRPSYS